jgi:hypothetical protein
MHLLSALKGHDFSRAANAPEIMPGFSPGGNANVQKQT